MPDQIEKDDEKFNRMIVKQHPTADSFFSAERKSKGQDKIEEDDERMAIRRCWCSYLACGVWR